MHIYTSYLDNYDNLDESFLKLANRQKERDIKKYNHIFMGHWMMDTEGALFRMADIARNRITIDQYREKDIKEIVVSWDPGGKDKSKDGGSHVLAKWHQPGFPAQLHAFLTQLLRHVLAVSRT